MNSLFDEDVPQTVPRRKYSMEYKMRYIFEKLIAQLDPEIIAIKKIKRYNAMGIRGKAVLLKNYVCHCDLSNKLIEHPFVDVSLIITKKRIQIQGSDFKYQFPTFMLMEVWERLKPIVQ